MIEPHDAADRNALTEGTLTHDALAMTVEGSYLLLDRLRGAG